MADKGPEVLYVTGYTMKQHNNDTGRKWIQGALMGSLIFFLIFHPSYQQQEKGFQRAILGHSQKQSQQEGLRVPGKSLSSEPCQGRSAFRHSALSTSRQVYLLHLSTITILWHPSMFTSYPSPLPKFPCLPFPVTISKSFLRFSKSSCC